MLPYNRKNISRAKELRKSMTRHERKLWYDYLRDYPIRFQRQKAIGEFIADFYCAKAHLVIELDGSGHYSTEEQEAYDAFRTSELAKFKLRVMRFTNSEIDTNFYGVCNDIDRAVKESLSQLLNFDKIEALDKLPRERELSDSRRNIMKTLKEAYKDYFDVGAAVSDHWLEEAADTLKAHFNSITCENSMKYTFIHDHQYERPPFKRPKPGERPEMPKIEITNRERFVHPCLELNTAGADKVYDFALQNGIKLRGHTLAWHGSYPWGIFEQLTPEELETNTREHMEFMAKKYPACWCWDVVNEAADDKHGLFLRETVFKNKFGDDYLVKLYAMAREYFPDSVFVCNDYNEWVPHKRDSILKIVDTLKANGLVDAIGCQCHVSAFMTDREYDEIKYAYEAYAKTGLRIHVTEMDVNCVSWKEPCEVTAETLEKQAEVYDKMFKLFREYKDVIDSVTLWGVSDKHTWLNGFKNRGIKNCALLFDTDYNPTTALSRIVDF